MKLPTLSQTGTAVTVDRWYDRKARTWVVQKKDEAGNQVGDAGFSGSKHGAVLIELDFKKEILES